MGSNILIGMCECYLYTKKKKIKLKRDKSYESTLSELTLLWSLLLVYRPFHILACHTETRSWHNKFTEEETHSTVLNPFSDALKSTEQRSDHRKGYNFSGLHEGTVALWQAESLSESHECFKEKVGSERV